MSRPMASKEILVKIPYSDNRDSCLICIYYTDHTFEECHHDNSINCTGKWRVTEDGMVQYNVKQEKPHDRWSDDPDSEKIVNALVERELLGVNDGW